MSSLEPGETYAGPFNNIFVSQDWATSSKLMLLIQGAGAVRYGSSFSIHFCFVLCCFVLLYDLCRAGQWARALCINENLDIGTILPYLKKCKEQGYGSLLELCSCFSNVRTLLPSIGVIVLNPNLYYGYKEEPEIIRKLMLINGKVQQEMPKKLSIKGTWTVSVCSLPIISSCLGGREYDSPRAFVLRVG